MQEYNSGDPKYVPEEGSETSTVGGLLKGVAWIYLVICIFACILLFIYWGGVWVIISSIGAFISFLMIYAMGEICCLLADIKENTKHLRNYRP